MDFITATTTFTVSRYGLLQYVPSSAKTVYALTDKALDLINFFSQLLTVSFGILFGLVVLMIVLLIFKS